MSTSTSRPSIITLFLVLFPVGLITGTIYSLHLAFKKDRDAQEVTYLVHQDLSRDKFLSTARKADLIGDIDFTDPTTSTHLTQLKRFIQSSLSSAGTGLQFQAWRDAQEREGLYTDLPSTNANTLACIVIPLEGTRQPARNALISGVIQLTKALIDDQQPITYRIVFAPVHQSPSQHINAIERTLNLEQQKIIAFHYAYVNQSGNISTLTWTHRTQHLSPQTLQETNPTHQNTLLFAQDPAQDSTTSAVETPYFSSLSQTLQRLREITTP